MFWVFLFLPFFHSFPLFHVFLFMGYLNPGNSFPSCWDTGHFPHSWEDVPVHVILPTCPAYTHVHTRVRELSVLHPTADPDVPRELPAEGRAAFWQGATKAR